MYLPKNHNNIRRNGLRWLKTVVPLLAMFQFLQVHGLVAAKTDPVMVLLQAYGESAKRIRHQATPPKQINQWRQDWLQRMLDVAAQNPKSPHTSRALAAAVGLANSSEDFVKSQQIIRQILELVKDVPSERAKWMTELGEVTKLKYRQSKSEEDRLAAIQAFEEANRLIGSEKTLGANFKEQLILNLAWIGSLRSSSSATQEELKQAANDYSEARRALQEYGRKPQGRLTGTGYCVEQFAAHEAAAAARADDNVAARKALRFLLGSTDKQSSVSLYVEQCAEKAFPRDSKKYRQFIEGWLKEAPEDERTAVLKYLVAESYMSSKDYEKAAAIYEELNSKYVDALLKIDKEAIRQGRGGYYATVLHNLCNFYVNRKEYAKAAAVNKRFLELYPNYDTLTKEAKAMQPWIEGQIGATERKAAKKALEYKEMEEALAKQRAPRPVSQRPLFWGALVLLIGLTGILVRRRRRR